LFLCRIVAGRGNSINRDLRLSKKGLLPSILGWLTCAIFHIIFCTNDNLNLSRVIIVKLTFLPPIQTCTAYININIPALQVLCHEIFSSFFYQKNPLTLDKYPTAVSSNMASNSSGYPGKLVKI
jgi:hypothetical protein